MKTIKQFFLFTALCASQVSFGMQHSQFEDQNINISFRQNFDVNASLIDAARRHAIAEMRYLLENGAEVDTQDEEGKTPLMHAGAIGGALASCKLLLEYGADTTLVDNEGKTAVQIISTNYRTVLQLLDMLPEDDRAQMGLALAPDEPVSAVFMQTELLIEILEDPKKILAVVMNGSNRSLKRLKRDGQNMCDAIMRRELSLK